MTSLTKKSAGPKQKIFVSSAD